MAEVDQDEIGEKLADIQRENALLEMENNLLTQYTNRVLQVRGVGSSRFPIRRSPPLAAGCLWPHARLEVVFETYQQPQASRGHAGGQGSCRASPVTKPWSGRHLRRRAMTGTRGEGRRVARAPKRTACPLSLPCAPPPESHSLARTFLPGYGERGFLEESVALTEERGSWSGGPRGRSGSPPGGVEGEFPALRWDVADCRRF